MTRPAALAEPTSRPAPQRHLMHVFPSFGIGGAEVRFTKVANRLGQSYRHTVVALNGDYSCAALLDPALRVDLVRVPVRSGRGLDPANLMRFVRLLHARRPDILVTQNWGAVEWALAHRLWPVGRHLHFEDGFGPEEADGRQLPRRVWMRRLALGRRSRVVVPSHTLARIAHEQWRLAGPSVIHVPNGVDSGRFRPDAPRDPALAPLRQDHGGLLVGAVGCLRAEKNFARLLRVIASLPDDLPVHAVIVGDGPERAALERQAAGSGIAGRVTFLGQHPRPEAVLPWLDVFTLPSDTEQMPISLLEAMATGLPAVATDVGDVRAVVAAENQPLIVPRDDEAGFADRLVAMARDAERRRAVGQANRLRVERDFTAARMIAAYDALFAA